MVLLNKRVVHFTNTYIPADNRIHKELDALGADDTWDVYAFGLSQGRDPTVTVSGAYTPFNLSLVSPRLLRLPRPLRYALQTVEMTSKYFRRARKLAPHIVHCHDAMALPVGVLLRLSCGSKLIYDAHELESDKGGQSRALSLATKLIERASWRFVDRFISVSPSIVNWYRQTYGPKESLVVLNTPAQKEANVESIHTIRDASGTADGERLFVYVGLLAPGRGIEAALTAFTERLTDSHLAFIGDGVLRNDIEWQARQHANIHYHQVVDHDELVGFIHDADGALCLIENVSLSDYYCLPNKLFEYAFAGIPVIASDFPEMARVVNEYSLGICTTPTVAALAEAVETLLSGDRLQPSADLAELDWEMQAAELRKLYRGL